MTGGLGLLAFIALFAAIMFAVRYAVWVGEDRNRRLNRLVERQYPQITDWFIPSNIRLLSSGDSPLATSLPVSHEPRIRADGTDDSDTHSRHVSYLTDRDGFSLDDPKLVALDNPRGFR